LAHNINVTDVRRMRELDLVWGLLLVLAVFLISTFVAFVLLVSVGWNPFRGGATYEAGIVAALAVGRSLRLGLVSAGARILNTRR
jgi:hypothetical protein